MMRAGRRECSSAANWSEHLAASMTNRGAVFEDKTLLYINEPGRWRVWLAQGRKRRGPDTGGPAAAGAGVGGGIEYTALVFENGNARPSAQTRRDEHRCTWPVSHDNPRTERI